MVTFFSMVLHLGLQAKSIMCVLGKTITEMDFLGQSEVDKNRIILNKPTMVVGE